MDVFALRLANRLVGNPENSDSLEITLAGAELEVLRDCEFALAGADLAPIWIPIRLRVGKIFC